MRSIGFGFLFCLVLTWALLSTADVGSAQPRSAGPGKYRLISYAWGPSSYGMTRYNVSTGEAAFANSGTFQKYTEVGPIPNGDYEVQVRVLNNQSNVTLRIETNSGRVWYVSGNNTWVEMKNPAPPVQTTP